MLTDIGVKDLVNDHASHNESHGCTEGEDEADRCAGSPVVLLEIDEALLGEHRDITG